MRRDNKIVSINFEYDMPDDYLAQTNNNNLKGQWTYTGPHRLWVFVDKETNKIPHTGALTDENDGEDYPTPLDQIKVLLDCEKDPLLCEIFEENVDPLNRDDLEQITETLPNGQTYSRPKNIPPDHCYQVEDIEYDPATGAFKKPLPWKKPHITWEEFRRVRNARLESSDTKVNDDMPASIKKAWDDYRQALRDFPQSLGAAPGEDPPVAPWKPILPPTPDDDSPGKAPQ